jgi:hypothetical protein
MGKKIMMQIKKTYTAIWLLLSMNISYAQEAAKTLHRNENSGTTQWYSLLAGCVLSHYGYAEIGLARFSQDEDARHYNLGAKSISVEIWPGKDVIIGPKVSIWGGGMTPMLMGLTLAGYTDFNKACLVFRPEAGLGLEYFKVMYGYNAPLINKDFNRLNRHLVSASFFIRLKKKQP